MQNKIDIRYLEKLAFHGHVALEAEEYDGWELRFSKGYTSRSNSVIINEDSTLDLETKVAYCEEKYASKGLPCSFKITELEKELSDYLTKRGYKAKKIVDMMILKLEDGVDFGDYLSSDEISFDKEPGDWFDHYFEFEDLDDESSREICKEIHSKVAVDKLYVKGFIDGKVAGVLSVVIEDGYMLIHNFVVDRNFRGRGFGEKLFRATLAKAKELGLKYAYLQVLQNNNVAISLYNKIGFKKIYSYSYMEQD